MTESPRDDLDRFNRLVELSRRGVLSDDEERHIGKVYYATRWGCFNQSIDFLMYAGAVRAGFQRTIPWRYFGAAEREQIDAILARHSTDQSGEQSS